MLQPGGVNGLHGSAYKGSVFYGLVSQPLAVPQSHVQNTVDMGLYGCFFMEVDSCLGVRHVDDGVEIEGGRCVGGNVSGVEGGDKCCLEVVQCQGLCFGGGIGIGAVYVVVGHGLCILQGIVLQGGVVAA